MANKSMNNGNIKWEEEVKKLQIDFDFFDEMNDRTHQEKSTS